MTMKKIWAVVPAVFLCVGLGATLPGQAAALPEGDMARTCKFSVSQNADQRGYLYDGADSTSWKGGKGAYIDITGTAPIGGLYLIWNSEPTPWTLSDRGEGEPRELSRSNGDGFVHEYIPVEGGPRALRLTMGGAASVGSLHVLPEGDAPAWVQRWQPPLEKADMLLASTHADDEHLWFAGAMPVYAGQFGKKVQVSFLMRHGYGRTHELLNGLWTVGIRHYPLLAQFKDQYFSTLKQGYELYKEDDVMAWQMMLLRRFKPEVVLVQDLNGEYGHGAHKMNSHTLTQALTLAGDASRYSESAAQYGVWTPKKCYVHLYEKNQVMMDWSRPLSRFGGLSGMDMAYNGYACHVSQVKRGIFKLLDGGKYDNRLFGLFFTTVGPDVNKNDFFENIAPCIPWDGLSPSLYDKSTKGAPYSKPGTESSQPPESSKPPKSSAAPESSEPPESSAAPKPGEPPKSSAAPKPSEPPTTASSPVSALSPLPAGAPPGDERPGWTAKATVVVLSAGAVLAALIGGAGIWMVRRHGRGGGGRFD